MVEQNHHVLKKVSSPNQMETTTSEVAAAIESQAKDTEGVAYKMTELGGDIEQIKEQAENFLK